MNRRPCLCTKKNPVGVKLFSHVQTFFYSKQFAKQLLLTTWLETIYQTAPIQKYAQHRHSTRFAAMLQKTLHWNLFPFLRWLESDLRESEKLFLQVVYVSRQSNYIKEHCLRSNTTVAYMKEDHRSYIRNFCSCEKKAWKNFRLVPDSIRTLDLCDTGAALYQLS